MTIRIAGDSLISVGEEDVLFKLVSVFKETPHSLEFFMEIFNQFPHKNKYSEEKLERTMHDLKITYPNIKEEIMQSIEGFVKLIYAMSDDEISYLRGALVEIVVAELGPNNEELACQFTAIKDGQFYEDEERLGEAEGYSDSNVDSIFYSQEEYEKLEDVCCESFECKASLQSYLYVVQGKRPPEIIDARKYKKLKYLEYLIDFFGKSKHFSISFATFQKNLQKDARKLGRMNVTKIDLVGGNDISNAWVRKFS